jgi:ferredoxin-NADP reductase
VVGEFWSLITTYPGMLLALAATVALCLVAVTSVRLARRKLRYESWHLLHLYAYLGVGLAIPHELWTGAQFLDSGWATFYWWTLYLAAAGAILVFRVGLPLWRSARHRLRVTSVVPEGAGVVSVYMTGRHMDRLKAEAGQFFTWRFLSGPGWTRANPYSLSAAPDGRSLRITIQGVGDGSVATRGLRPGTRVIVEGPYGRLSARPRTRRKVALIGAGVGITPLRALAEGLSYAPGEAILVERFSRQPLFARELDQLSRERGLQLLRLPGRRRRPDSWLGDGLDDGLAQVDDLGALRHWVPDVAERDVYLCGPEPWTALVRRTLEAAGLPPAQIHLETFAW